VRDQVPDLNHSVPDANHVALDADDPAPGLHGRVPERHEGVREPHDWVIVGGGPHGVCAGQALHAQGASIRIIEPSGRLLHRWGSRASAVGMTWMRSPVGHHLDAQPGSLHQFLHLRENAEVAELAGTFRRPTYDAFLRHSRALVARHRLDEAVIPGRVDSIRTERDHLLVQGQGVEIAARRVLIATGSNVPRTPPWARRLQREGAPIHHAFGPGAQLDHDILGGGISAVQRALMVQRSTGQTVRLWMRRPVRVADFDVDRSWAKHRFVGRWVDLQVSERLNFLHRHAVGGSVPSGLASRLARAVRRGSIELQLEAPSVEWDAAKEHLVLRGGGRVVESSGLTLATGLQRETVTGWLRTSAERLGLPIINGIPRLDSDMHWGRGVHVCGPLARLRLGPMATNIIGARWAASKLPSVRMQPV